jgi:hypothetical protein
MTVHKTTHRRVCHIGMRAVLMISTAILTPVEANANNFGESLAWQFRTSTDQVNQAALLDVIQKQRGGYYAAPIYNTTIARQYNCAIAPVATGNQGYQSATANSPTVTGATSQASGNSNSSTASDGHGATLDTQQGNAGAVFSGVTGSTNTVVSGTASQALNSTQSNSGTQSASVSSSSACSFGALN